MARFAPTETDALICSIGSFPEGSPNGAASSKRCGARLSDLLGGEKKSGPKNSSRTISLGGDGALGLLAARLQATHNVKGDRWSLAATNNAGGGVVWDFVARVV